MMRSMSSINNKTKIVSDYAKMSSRRVMLLLLFSSSYEEEKKYFHYQRLLSQKETM